MKENVIRRIANHLDNNSGLMIIRELGVTESTIQQAQTAHAKQLPEMFLFCLRHWCKKDGCNANKAVLKKALERYDRKDLAEEVDDIDPDPSE